MSSPSGGDPAGAHRVFIRDRLACLICGTVVVLSCSVAAIMQTNPIGISNWLLAVGDSNNRPGCGNVAELALRAHMEMQQLLAGKSSTDYARSCEQLASIYDNESRRTEAVSMWRRAASVYRVLVDSAYESRPDSVAEDLFCYSNVLLSLSASERAIGDPEAALNELEEFERIRSLMHRRLFLTLNPRFTNEKVAVLRALDRQEEAATVIEHAEQDQSTSAMERIEQPLNANAKAQLAREWRLSTYDDAARESCARQDWEQAEKHLCAAATFEQQVRRQGHPMLPMPSRLSLLGFVREMRKNYVGAAEAYDQSIVASASGKLRDPALEAICLHNRAALAKRLGDNELAKRLDSYAQHLIPQLID